MIYNLVGHHREDLRRNRVKSKKFGHESRSRAAQGGALSESRFTADVQYVKKVSSSRAALESRWWNRLSCTAVYGRPRESLESRSGMRPEIFLEFGNGLVRSTLFRARRLGGRNRCKTQAVTAQAAAPAEEAAATCSSGSGSNESSSYHASSLSPLELPVQLHLVDQVVGAQPPAQPPQAAVLNLGGVGGEGTRVWWRDDWVSGPSRQRSPLRQLSGARGEGTRVWWMIGVQGPAASADHSGSCPQSGGGGRGEGTRVWWIGV